jgi:hypothetical protein
MSGERDQAHDPDGGEDDDGEEVGAVEQPDEPWQFRIHDLIVGARNRDP